MITVTDQMGRRVNLAQSPTKIISLVPSITELLFDLELDNQIVGITRFCIYPKEKVKSKIIVGDTKNVDSDLINSIKPDLIIASKEENTKEEIEALMDNLNVYVSDVKTFSDALELIRDIGILTNKEKNTSLLIENIEHQFKQLKKTISSKRKVAYLIWNNPIMTINSDTFINDMLNMAGYKNVFENRKERYPIISVKEIRNKKPEYILLSTEPYSFTDDHVVEFKRDFPFTKVILVDGKKFSWYGSHLIKVPAYFKQMY